MIETQPEILSVTKLFNQSGQEYSRFVTEIGALEIPVAVNDYAGVNSVNAGAMQNVLEYERRLAYFFALQLNINEAVGDYLDYIGYDWMGNARPLAFGDAGYAAYLKKKIIGAKESPLALINMLQDLSSEPVLIIENGGYTTTGFWDAFYMGYDFPGTTSGGDLITPDILSGTAEDDTDAFYFRCKIQPIDETAERLIIILLAAAHVAGVGYDIQYYFVPPWH